MFGAMMKLLPVGVLAAGVSQGTDKAGPLIEYVNTVIVQYEADQISKMIMLDATDEDELPKAENFSQYVKQHMRIKSGADPSIDKWGKSYKLTYSQYNVIVSSSGPDMTWDTSDDIFSRRKL